MSKEFINYGTFLEFASLLDPENYPENYSGSGHRKSPKTLVKMIKMFDLYIYRFNHRIGLYGADNYIDAELSISPYDFCSDPKISKKNFGFDLQEYTESLITKIKDEEYIPTVPELEPYRVFINHKVFNDTLDNEIDLDFHSVLEDFVVGTSLGISPIDKKSSIVSEKYISNLQKQIVDYQDNFEFQLPHDCYYSELSESNCVARMQQVKKNMNILCCKLDNLSSMKNMNEGQRSKERNSTLRELGNYAKIYDDLKFFKKTHKCLPKSKSELEFCRTFPAD